LASAIWPNHDPKRRHMTLLTTAYFDASGKSDDPREKVLFVSGFVSSVAKWSEFDRAWDRLLGRHDIKSPFRMSAFNKACGTDTERRDRFVSAATRLLARQTQYCFSCGVVLSVHREAMTLWELPEWAAYPFALAGAQVVAKVDLWRRRRKLANMPKVIFEHGDLDMGQLLNRVYARTGYLIGFEKRDDIPGLQAADLLAWHHGRLVRTNYTAGRAVASGTMHEIVTKLRHGNPPWGIIDSRWFMAHSHRWPTKPNHASASFPSSVQPPTSEPE
jgi:hypothetical protein